MELKDIKELIRFFDKSDIAELEIEKDEVRLYLSKFSSNMPVMPQMMPQMMASVPAQQSSTQSVAQETVVEVAETKGTIIESPMIGTFYCASAPGAAPYVKVGDVVNQGQTLCIVEAMKIMNTIEADFRCRILEIKVKDGEPVEYGQALFVVEPQ